MSGLRLRPVEQKHQPVLRIVAMSRYLLIRIALVVLFCLTSLTTRSARGEEPFRIYWTDAGNTSPVAGTGRITRATIDGSRQEVIYADTFEYPKGLAVDWRHAKIYWGTGRSKSIMISNLDGSDLKVLLDWELNEATLEDIAVDSVGGKIYWADQNMDKIRRANLDGSDIEDLVSIDADEGATSAVLGIDFSRELNTVFWTDWRKETIESFNLTSGELTIISEGLDFPIGIAVNADTGLLYHSRFYSGLYRSSLGGGDQMHLVGNAPMWGIDLHAPSSNLYWCLVSSFGTESDGSLRSSDLDGHNIEFVIKTGLKNPNYLDVLPEEIDLTDYAQFATCAANLRLGDLSPECNSFDFDQDGDVDLVDFGQFQRYFTGPFEDKKE